LLAIKAIQSGQIKSIQAAAKAYNVKWYRISTTLIRLAFQWDW